MSYDVIQNKLKISPFEDVWIKRLFKVDLCTAILKDSHANHKQIAIEGTLLWSVIQDWNYFLPKIMFYDVT